MEISLAVTEPTSVLWLHGKALTVKEATVMQGGATLAATQVPGTTDVLGFIAPTPAGEGHREAAHLL